MWSENRRVVNGRPTRKVLRQAASEPAPGEAPSARIRLPAAPPEGGFARDDGVSASMLRSSTHDIPGCLNATEGIVSLRQNITGGAPFCALANITPCLDKSSVLAMCAS